jgi:23S rRNA (cytosine1962-C5)-methyltransferase
MCLPGLRVQIDDVDLDCLPNFPAGTHDSWFAWVDEPAWFGGALELDPGEGGEAPEKLRFEIDCRVSGLARLSISGCASSAAQVCRALAALGMPVVGDLVGGGLASPGGVALAASRAQLDSIRPPVAPPDANRDAGSGAEPGTAARSVTEDPPWPEAAMASRGEPLILRVSREAARALERGHPWVLPDDASDSAAVFAPGSEVRVEDRSGHVLGWAWTEGDARLSARMAESGSVEHGAIASIESRVARAIARRRGLLEASAAGRPDRTDCYRLIHGEGDGLPGLFVDRLGPLLRVLVTGRASDGFRERAIDALRAQLPTTPEGVSWSLIELLHLRAGRDQAFDRVRFIAGGLAALEAAGVEPVGAGFWVEEDGLKFSVDPGWDSPQRTRPGFGLFPDQRENRARLAPLAARGGRWLNLFAHTGAFSTRLLAAGAEEMISVDLSGPYLARLEANLEANRIRGVDPTRHRSIRAEGRRAVESLEEHERFSGIILDPPTAAAAGRRFWSVRQDLEPLLRICIGRLEAGGCLLVTQNGRGTTLGLDRILERIASRSRRPVRSIAPAGPGEDYHALPGFPEGDAFEGWLLELE